MHCFAFDIETVPDTELGRRLFDLDGLDEEDVAKAMFALRKQHTGGALTGSISTRGLVQVATLLREEYSMEAAFEAVIGLWDSESRAALRTILKVTA